MGLLESEMNSVPTTSIRVELFCLSVRHLHDGDLIEEKKGALCRNSIECEGILTGEGSLQPAFSPNSLTLTLQNQPGPSGQRPI